MEEKLGVPAGGVERPFIRIIDTLMLSQCFLLLPSSENFLSPSDIRCVLSTHLLSSTMVLV